MNLKLNEWNESCDYADEVCEKLKGEGYNVKAAPYTMYDGRKGIYLRVFDNRGNFAEEYATGIQTNINDMKKSIDQQALRIIQEC